MLSTPGSACRLLAFALLASSALVGPAHAQSWEGGVDSDWFNPGNWDLDRVPTRGDFEVYVDTDANNPVVIDGQGNIVNLARLFIGPNNRAALTVQGGAQLIVDSQSGIGGGQITGTAGNGTLLIRDTGTEVSFGAQIYVAPRANSAGSLSVLNGAVLRGSDSAVFGTAEGSLARINVSGAGSRIEMPGALYMGGNATTPDTYDAELNLLDGGKMIGGASVSHILGNGSRVTISGAGSELRGATALDITGQMRIEDGGTLQYETITTGGSALIELKGGLLNAAAVASSGGLTLREHSRVIGSGGEIRVGSRLGMFENAMLTLNGTDLQANSIRMLGSATLNVGAADGEAPGAAGVFEAGTITLEQAGTRLVLNHDGQLALATPIYGFGMVLHRAGQTRLTAAEQTGFSGLFDVTGGTVSLEGMLAAGEVRVSNGATFGGTGTLGSGRLAMLDGTLSPAGSATGTLTLAALRLAPESILDFQLGQSDQAPGVGNDFIQVGTSNGTGILVLDGTLNIADAGGFGAGLYRLIDYRGALTDNGLAIGLAPAGYAPGDLTVQTSIANRINLVVSAPVSGFTFWDGPGLAGDAVVAGGAGSWTRSTANWSIADGTHNGAYDPTQLLVFAGTGATVNVDEGEGEIAVGAGMQFATDGYRLTGDAIGLTGEVAQLRVGDGSSAGITATIDAPLIGTAAIIKTDLGTLILSGANSYGGGTTILQGTIRAPASSIPGDVSIAAEGTLHFDQATDGAYGAGLSGAGRIRKTGGGTLSLTGSSIDFAGATVVEAGVLAIDGALGGATRIDAGAVLTGDGRLGSLDLAGALSPGSGTATLTVEGNVVFRPGSTYSVDLAASGGTDLIDVAGSVTIEGGTVAVTVLDRASDYASSALYRIVDAGQGMTGSFSGLSGQSAFLDFSLEYDPNGASIRVSQVLTFPDVALTYNQRQAAGVLRELDRTGGSDALAVYNSILILDATAARASFELSSGEIYASLLAGEQRRTLNLAGQYALRSVAVIEEGAGIWGGVTGQAAHVSSDGNGARFTQDGVGFEMGVDYCGDANGWAAGVGGGWQSGNLDAAARASEADTNSWYLGGYVRYGSAGAGFTAMANIVKQWTEARVTRAMNFGDVSRRASARPDIGTTAGRIDLRYGVSRGRWSLGPTADVEASTSQLDAFTESGAQALNLAAGKARDQWVRYGIGAFARLDDERGNLEMSARLVTGPRNDADVDLALAGSPHTFNIRAPHTSGTGALVEGSGHYRLSGYWSLSGQVRLLATSGETDLAGSVRLNYLF
ncbi:hypothetical protein AEB_P2516 [Altererythrobacter sp. B11]|uniref:autotransporter outer membrane beta-barrel domain-containing protein n=1 Tax=Altererythrobacter sp. B11 TaxID=2060312 RepID=UPI000DC6FA8B|nr:autotransporter domain-containing protein [Altererythrobacter sp. B11]BBC73384.1 hypothetical protein AEB_P2516 [Altererythrobacter sp. B11]